MNWEQALESFCKDNNKLHPHTIYNYKNAVKDFFAFCPKEIIEVNTTDVVEWYNYLKTRYKRTTIRLKILDLRLFYAYLNEEGIVGCNPAAGIRIRMIELQEKDPITRDEYKLLINESKHNLKHQVIMAILYTAGLRPNELVKLKIEDIDWDRTVLLVNDNKKQKQREVILTYDCLTRLKTYLQNKNDDSGLVFPSDAKKGQPITVWGIQWCIKKYKKKLAFTKQLSPQVFRFTYASNLWAAGFSMDEIALLMGHEDIKITQMYIKCLEDRLKQKYNKYYH